MIKEISAKVEFFFVKNKFEKKVGIFPESQLKFNDGLKNYLHILEDVLKKNYIFMKEIKQQSEPYIGCKCSTTKQDIYFQQNRFRNYQELQKFLEELIQSENLYHAKNVESIVKILRFGNKIFDESEQQVEQKKNQPIQDDRNIFNKNGFQKNDSNLENQKYQNTFQYHLKQNQNEIIQDNRQKNEQQKVKQNLNHQQNQTFKDQQKDKQNPNYQQNGILKKNQLKQQNDKVQIEKANFLDSDEEEAEADSTPYHDSNQEYNSDNDNDNDDESYNKSQQSNILNQGFLDKTDLIISQVNELKDENIKLQQQLDLANETIRKLEKEKIQLNKQNEKLVNKLKQCKCQ
ncbi:hypothetical protein TTHERM_000160719 (macronuclear) [Tetrahymena thermophila SB210]|uniref:Uncharacterized protein n=1 Tax=Tetrahymena thermophila (strain SB210) TaxID=312017 RepID=W7XLA8_TETTS|nr:hypothetical protein TTHERM_000160719 [Tetrahymena thermophila SB210]EWS75964.1 hypothetical protein TTHERM_000160719 [Tetrahymena thermophila SB210]|eukprot:XP_012651482.1 hypothetical protein TTHERM_000160719 [Tetrahymena thermophila SB210]